MKLLNCLKRFWTPKWKEVKYEMKSDKSSKCLTVCPYDMRKGHMNQIIKVWSHSCCMCKHHVVADAENKIVKCSYEYDKIS